MQPRVLLIKSRSLVTKNMGSNPPLGVMYLAAYLRQQLGAEVRLLDLKFLARPVEDVLAQVADFRPHLVGLSALTAESHMANKVAAAMGRAAPGLPLIMGGPHPTVAPEEALAVEEIDAAVLGEGEETLAELCRLIMDAGEGWRDPAALGAVAGVAYRGPDGQVLRSPARPQLEDLDALPFPAWDLIDVDAFARLPGMASAGIRPYMPIFTSRGCPYGCRYCQHMFGRRFRARSVENVVAEILEIRRLGITDVEVLDDISNFDAQRLEGIFEELLRRGAPTTFSFPNGVRADLLRPRTMELLKRVGAGEVSVAVETASPRLQKLLRKNLDLEKVRRNINRMADLRIPTRGFFMLGFPGETRQELQATVDYACGSRLHLALFFTVNPYQNADLLRLYREQGMEPPRVSSIDHEYYGSPFNGSELPDAEFRRFYRLAYLRFFANPRRIYRIARDRGQYRDLPRRVYGLVTNINSFRRLREEDGEGVDG